MRRYAITNRGTAVGDRVEGEPAHMGTERLLGNVRRWAREGVEYVQIREKDLPGAVLTQLTVSALRARDRGAEERAAALAEAATKAAERTRILVNTSLEAALAAGADGVHLTGSWSALPEAREQELGQHLAEIRQRYRVAGLGRPTVSISCHTIDEVRVAAVAGADLLLFSPVFGKVLLGKGIVPGVGLSTLRTACGVAGVVPVYALGGVTWERAPECLAAGAVGIAGIRLFEG